MKKDIKKIILTIFNLAIFVSTLVYTILGVKYGAGNGQLGNGIIGIMYFKPFTIDSNVLMAIISLIYLVFLIGEMIYKVKIPYWVNVLYLVGTVSVMLTFITVLLFLMPVNCASDGVEMGLAFYSQDMFFYHLLNPILSAVSFFLIKEEKPFGLKENLISIIPMFIYSVVYLVNVVFTKAWEDFYGFTFGGKNYLIPVVIVVMYGAVFLIGFLLIKIKAKINKNT